MTVAISYVVIDEGELALPNREERLGCGWRMPLQHGQDAILNRDHAVSVLLPATVRERDR